MRASRRKAGTLADCPHCRQPNMVPAVAMGDPTDASTALAQAEGRFVPQGGGFDDIADLIGAPSAPTAGARPPSGGMPAFEPASQRVQARTSIRSNVTEDALLVITRRGVYAHGTLLLFVALAFLAAGYWIGHGTLPEIPAANDTTSMPSESAIKFEGNLSYLAAPGEIKPDAEAVVIVLPFDARPEHKLASRGLRPTDTSATEKAAAAASLRILGGG
ncbi:MAG TPA: hypothetical protein VGX78_04540, partial [Pirellulales bacterium]|nr:hypothetical protein [Pirellulales bacterium]